MGVSLGYRTIVPVAPGVHREILALATEANTVYEWWCECIWFDDTPSGSGIVYGFTKLFCMIDDEDTDTYMAYLDVCEIVRFLTTTAEGVGVEWRLDIEAAPFGAVTRAGPDAELRANLAGFLDMFPGNFDTLRSRTRQDILVEWSNR